MSFHTVNNRFTLCLHYILLRTIKSKFRFNDPSTKTSTTIAVCAVKNARIHTQIFLSNPQENAKKVQVPQRTERALSDV